MVPEIVPRLLAIVHRYYPVGMPQIWYDYEGTRLLKSIVKDKIDDILSKKPTGWSQFVEQVRQHFIQNFVNNVNYLQFPNYQIEINVENIQTQEYDVEKKLVLNMSLLTNCFTIFFREYFQKRVINVESNENDVQVFTTVFLHSDSSTEMKEMFSGLKKMYLSFFPEYEFVNHKLLFDYKIRGGITNESVDLGVSENSFYECLFDNGMQPNRIMI